MQSCFSDFKSVNNLDILFSLSKELSNNSSLLYLASSLSLFISSILFFADNPNSITISQNLHLSSKVVKSTSNFSKISFISSPRIFNFLFISFFSCSINDSRFFLSHSIYFLNLLFHP